MDWRTIAGVTWVIAVLALTLRAMLQAILG